MKNEYCMGAISTAPSFHDVLDTAAAWAGHKVRRAFAAMCEWQRRANERHALRRFDADILNDVGISRARIKAEANKPFWVE